MKTDSFAAERRKFERLSKERTDQDKTIGVLRTAIDGLKEKLFKVESEKDNIKESSHKNNLKESAEVAGVKKELAALKTKVGIITQSRDKAQTEITSLKVRDAEQQQIIEKLKQEAMNSISKTENAMQALEQARKEKVKFEIENQNLKEQSKVGGNVGGAVSYDAMALKCKELEQDNKILRCQTKTVVVYNKEFGTFEYIGDPRPLNFSEELTSLKDVLREIQNWVNNNSRLSVGPIFYSLDKGNFGELNDA